MSGSSTLSSALELAGRGWSVLPLHSVLKRRCTCKNPACTSPGKHPRTRGGVRDAVSDPVRIREWWARWPDANIGIATGAASGFDVLDIDDRHDGDETVAVLVKQYGSLPETVCSKTGGAGLHILFQHDPHVRNRANILPGLDVKADGGYIVGPGSQHISGGTYEWEGASHPDETPIEMWPAWLLKIVIGDEQKSRATARRRMKTIIDGERNDTLTSYAGTFRKMGLESDEIEPVLQAINQRRCAPPLDRGEVLQIATGMLRYEAGTFGGRGAVPPGYDNPMEAVMDVLRFGPSLHPNEFMVLLLHVERQLAYGKDSDAVSISQLADGLYSKKTSSWIRKGCGIGRSTAIRARRSLIERGFLVAEKQIEPDGSNGSTKYAVDWENLRSYFDGRRADLPAISVPERDTRCPSQGHTEPIYIECGGGLEADGSRSWREVA